MKEKVLITGGAGFIGSNTADALKEKGFSVRIMDLLEPPVHNGAWPSYIKKKGFDLLKGDVRKKNDWMKALRGVTYVIHLAAYQDQRPDFSKFFDTNTTSSALLYECIVEKKFPIKKVILASSQFVYGDGQYKCAKTKKIFYAPLRTLKQFEKKEWNIKCPCHGEDAIQIPFEEDQIIMPTNSYGLSKKAIEDLSLRLGMTYQIPTTLYRYSIVQGARQSPRNLYSGALRIFVSQALSGLPITVYEDGLGTRDFVNVHDVVAANILALKNKKTDFEIFNVGGGKAYHVLDFAKKVKKITNSKSEIVVGGFRRTDTRNAVSNISKFKKIGRKPKYNIDQSIKEYVTWFKNEGFDKKVDKNRLKKLKEGIRL